FVLRGQPERANQGHLRATGRIGALHRTGPQPSDGCGLTSTLISREAHFRIKVTDPALRLLTHPFAVVSDVLSQALGSGPPAREMQLRSRERIHGWLSSDPGRDLAQGLRDRDRHRIQVAGVGLQAETLRLQRYGATPAKGVQY